MESKNPCLETETSENHNVEQLPNGIELDEFGQPVGALPIQTFYDELGLKLIAHYGEEFRLLLNASRAKRGMQAL